MVFEREKSRETERGKPSACTLCSARFCRATKFFCLKILLEGWFLQPRKSAQKNKFEQNLSYKKHNKNALSTFYNCFAEKRWLSQTCWILKRKADFEMKKLRCEKLTVEFYFFEKKLAVLNLLNSEKKSHFWDGKIACGKLAADSR